MGPEGAMNVPGIPVGLFTPKRSSEQGSKHSKSKGSKDSVTVAPQSSLQFLVSSMFSSCTTGRHNCDNDSIDGSGAIPPTSLLNYTPRSSARTHTTRTITPSSSNGETSFTGNGPSSPSPLHQQRPASKAKSAVQSALQESSKKLFKNNHDIAQEAILRLRQQHQRDQAENVVRDSALDGERCSVRSANPSMFSTNPSLLSLNPSTLSNTRTLNSNTRTLNSSLIEASAISSMVAKKQQGSRKSTLQKFIPRTGKKTVKDLVPKKASTSESMPIHTRQDLSFFPVSKPKDLNESTRQDQRFRAKLKRNKGVPKEVTPKSPARMLQNRNKQHQKQVLNGQATGGANVDQLVSAELQKDSDENRDANDSWDIENDGISDITQASVDRMVLAISKHIRVFPEEAENLNRIHSDLTDPAPIRVNQSHDVSFEDQCLFPMIGGDVAGFTDVVTPSRKGLEIATKGMSPPHFSRNIGSMGTAKSFFTKTTQSTQTNDFANAFKIDEQNFWDTEVAKESPQTIFNTFRDNQGPMSPSRMVIKKQKRSGATTATASMSIGTTPTMSFSSKSRQSRSFKKHEDHTNREVFLTDYDRLMDNLILQDDLEMAEI